PKDVITCRTIGRCWNSIDQRPLSVAPPGICETCGCRPSRYRSPWETECAVCDPIQLTARQHRGRAPFARLRAQRTDAPTVRSSLAECVALRLRAQYARRRAARLGTRNLALRAQMHQSDDRLKDTRSRRHTACGRPCG